MSVRLAQVTLLQQLQTLDIGILQPLQQLSRDLITGSRSSWATELSIARQRQAASAQQQMTTGQQVMPLQRTMDNRKHKQRSSLPPCCSSQAPGASTVQLSPSSSTSDFMHMERSVAACAGNKSAKRKAAEALLAARYSSTPSPTAAAAAVHSSNVSLSWAASATVDLSHPEHYQSKRYRSTLSAAINKLQGAAESGSAAAAAPSNQSAQQHNKSKQQPSDKLQSVLERLQGQHQQYVHKTPLQQKVLLPEEQQTLQGILQEQQPQARAQQQHTQQHQQQRQQQQQQPNVSKVKPLAVLQQAHQFVQVPACNKTCNHSVQHGWCHTQVKLPHVEWSKVVDADVQSIPTFKIAAGYERLIMPEGLQVLIVENPIHLPAALQQLRASMHDPYVAIDLEWRPEFGRRFTPVAMMQLASSRMAVLVRTCRMNYRLPPALQEFLKDPKVHLLGFSWGSSDEPKMQSTFGVGCKDFGRFMDLQQVASGLGYNGFGLARLTKRVLGLNLPKSKKVSMSNWEAAVITKTQVKYAALDVLIAGQVFRALRLWHSSPSLCEVCHYNLGSAHDTPETYACSCGKDYKDIKAYLTHCERSNHEVKFAECEGCGCTRRLPWPNSSSQPSSIANSSSDADDAAQVGSG